MPSTDINEIIDALSRFPTHQVIRVLLSFICALDQSIRRNAISAMGILGSQLADRDFETARDVLRRLMWMLNDESGSSGWGAPEAMAEMMACHKGLALEYLPIFISYMDPEKNHLENPALQRDLLRGLVRLAGRRSALLKGLGVDQYLRAYLESEDPIVREMAEKTADILGSS